MIERSKTQRHNEKDKSHCQCAELQTRWGRGLPVIPSSARFRISITCAPTLRPTCAQPPQAVVSSRTSEREREYPPGPRAPPPGPCRSPPAAHPISLQPWLESRTTPPEPRGGDEPEKHFHGGRTCERGPARPKDVAQQQKKTHRCMHRWRHRGAD